jgi:hypothetical protein
MLDDLRDLRQLRPGDRDFKVTGEELDALLAAAAERDALRQQLANDWEGGLNHGN